MMAAARSRQARTVGDLLGEAAGAHAKLVITDLTLDSRQVTPGAAFALAGAREHGLNYAAQALAHGAAIVLYEPSPRHAVVPQPSIACPSLRDRLADLAQRFFAVKPPAITGITGTNGKTTVAYLLAQALTRRERPCACIGTLGFGVPPRYNAHGLTTPDCLTLHRELAELDAPQVAMEVSSHALAQDRIAGLRFHTAVFTNLTRDHLDEHGDLAQYGAAKARLFQLPDLKYAVVNADDPFATSLAAALPAGCELLRTSLHAQVPADLVGHLVRSDMSGVELATLRALRHRVAAIAVDRGLQRRELAGRRGRFARSRPAAACRVRSAGARTRGAGAHEVWWSTRSAVGGHRLCAHAGRAAAHAQHLEGDRARGARLRIRLRRRSRSRETPADGRDCRETGGAGRAHGRQSA